LGDLYLTVATKYSTITACITVNLAGATHFNARHTTIFIAFASLALLILMLNMPPI